MAESLEVCRNDAELRNNASDIVQKARCHFLLTGRATLREDGEPIHFLRLRGLVRLGPIHADAAAAFAKEFTEVFPQELTVSLQNDFRQFENHAKHLDLIARFVTGIAAGLSRDFEFSEQQLAELLEILTTVESKDRLTFNLRQRTEIHLRSCRDAYNDSLVRKYRRTRDKSAVIELERRLLALSPKEQARFEVEITLALADVVLRGDTKSARGRLTTFKKLDSPAWRFSMAFVDALEGDLQSAYKHYRHIEGMKFDGSIAVDVEEFIQVTLDDSPDQKQLLFLAGIINMRFKDDPSAARRDLNEFKNWAKHRPAYSPQVDAATKWLSELRYKRAP